MAENNQGRTQTSTQIRNLYSDGCCYLNISFFNVNLSFKFHAFLHKDVNTGRNIYDTKNGLNTTVNYEGAYILYDAAKNIIDGKEGSEGINISIPCAGGAELRFERKLGPSGQMETIFTIIKNNVTIPFKFETTTKQIIVNGQMVTKVIESGLGAFMKTIDGYLTGINADRHLDKLTDDYVKSMDYAKGGNTNNNYKKPYNGGYKNQNHGYNNQRNNQQWNPNQQQNMSSYNIQN